MPVRLREAAAESPRSAGSAAGDRERGDKIGFDGRLRSPDGL
jgi:hypothetical protein